MRFSHEITIAANTAEADPQVETMILDYGVIGDLTVQFPWGSAGLAGIRLRRYASQILPATPGEWLRGNDIVHRVQENLDLTQPPFELTIEGYNDDDSYEHLVIIHVDVDNGASGNNRGNRLLAGIRQVLGVQ